MCVPVVQSNQEPPTLSPMKSQSGGSPARASPAPTSPAMSPYQATAAERPHDENKASAGTTPAPHLTVGEQKTDPPSLTESKFDPATEHPHHVAAAEAPGISGHENGPSRTTTRPNTQLESDSDSSDQDMSW